MAARPKNVRPGRKREKHLVPRAFSGAIISLVLCAGGRSYEGPGRLKSGKGSVFMVNPYHRKPTLGMRNIKTALATAAITLVYYFLDRSPAFACIGAIFGMGSDMHDSHLNGGNRLFGTIIGGVLGMALFRIYLIFHPDGGRSLLLVPLMFIGTVLLILLCQYFWVGGVQPGGVVLCILLFNTPVESYVPYALNRILDTAVGVLVALAVNRFFPRERVLHWMHADGADEVPQDLGETAEALEETAEALEETLEETAEALKDAAARLEQLKGSTPADEDN